MRKCERCNVEMIQDNHVFIGGASSESGWNGTVVVSHINGRKKGPNSKIKKGSVLDKILDKRELEMQNFVMSIAVCPICGKVETYLDENTLSGFKDAYHNILKD